METLTSIAAVATALGGYELVRFLLLRRSNRRIAGAQAATEEFHALREYNEFLQGLVRNADERSAAQGEAIRGMNEEILRLTREKCAAEAELSLKRCEVRGCASRKPQNGF